MATRPPFATCTRWLRRGSSVTSHGWSATRRAPRICCSRLIASNSSAATAWPKGAAAVKELYATADGTTPVGYAVYLKTEADTAAGANWYWYERVPLDNVAPHDAHGVVADGMGGSGAPMMICVGCHMGAGMDAAHTPSPNGHDEVYTPVH